MSFGFGYRIVSMHSHLSSNYRLPSHRPEFDDDLEHLKKKGQTGAEFRIKKNQHSFLLNTFINLMTRYNDVQIEYRDKCKNKIKTELEISKSFALRLSRILCSH